MLSHTVCARMKDLLQQLAVALCLCACSLVTANVQDYSEEDAMILELIRQDGTEPESGSLPPAEFLRCNKVNH